MYFHSLSGFLAMGGYGFFVWSAYGISAVLIVLNMVHAARLPGRERRDIARRLHRDAERHDARGIAETKGAPRR